MVNGINNNTYLNKFGEKTFLSNIQKNNKSIMEQEKVINKIDNNSCDDNEMMEKIKEEEIARKIAEGKSVSLKELKYIKKNNLELFEKAKKANGTNKTIRNEIKSAETKDESIQIINKASLNSLMSAVSGNNPEEANVDLSLQGENVNKIEGESSLISINKLIY